MLFFSFYKSLVGKEITVELKNDLSITGLLQSVDQFLNIKLKDIKVNEEDKYPYMISVKNCFIRGSVVRYVHLPAEDVDVETLQDHSRLEAREQKKQNKQHQEQTNPKSSSSSTTTTTTTAATV